RMHAARGITHDPRQRLRTEFLRGFTRSHDTRGRSIRELRGVPGRDCALGLERGAKFAEAFGCRIGSNALVAADGLLRQNHGNDFVREVTTFPCRRSLLMTERGKA